MKSKNSEALAKQKELLSAVGKRVAKYGFTRCKGQSFYRKTDFGHQVLHLAFLTYDADFDATIDVAVRFDDVEDLVNASNDRLSRSLKKETATLGCELGNLTTGRQKVWDHVGTLGRIEHTASSMVAFFLDFGLPYLEKYSSKEVAFEVLSRDDSFAFLHSGGHADRGRRAVALTYLMHGPDAARQLAQKKRKRIQEMDERYLLWFDKFVDWLFEKRVQDEGPQSSDRSNKSCD